MLSRSKSTSNLDNMQPRVLASARAVIYTIMVLFSNPPTCTCKYCKRMTKMQIVKCVQIVYKLSIKIHDI